MRLAVHDIQINLDSLVPFHVHHSSRTPLMISSGMQERYPALVPFHFDFEKNLVRSNRYFSIIFLKLKFVTDVLFYGSSKSHELIASGLPIPSPMSA